MKFGVVLLTEQNTDYDPAAYGDDVARQGELVESLGFDSAWISEHHFTDHPYLDNFQALSYLAAVTEAVELGTSVCLAPLYNPVQLAERVAHLDALSGGRVTLGCGLGYRRQEFETLGIDRSRRVPRLVETLELFDRLWAEDGVSYDGDEFAFEDVSINPKPVQDGNPDVWLGGSVPAGARRAAHHGDAWFPGPPEPIADLEPLYEAYDAALDDAGREATARPLWREVFVAESREAAVEAARPSLAAKYATYDDWGGATGVADDEFEGMVGDPFLLGTPEDVIEGIERYRDEFDIDHLLLRTRWPEMDAATAEESTRLFAEEVMPAFE